MYENELLKKAAEVREKAYAPYSDFKVGAAVLTADGSVFTGCNVENASYGLTICAERAAIFAAVAAGHKDITALAIVADADKPVSPCGACRQVLAEFARGAEVFSANLSGGKRSWKTEELLPDAAFAREGS